MTQHLMSLISQYGLLVIGVNEIVLYCTCPSEASAARVAKVLVNHGFERVRPLFGGLDAWIAAGYPLQSEAAQAASAQRPAALAGGGAAIESEP